MDLNRDYATRNELLNVPTNDRMHYFSEASYETLAQLREMNFLDPQEKQNEAPSIDELMSFMKNMDEAGYHFTAHGYVVNSDRDDYRVSIEGLESDQDIPFELVSAFRFADEFRLNPFRCWWD